jgi:transposase InsO family protein
VNVGNAVAAAGGRATLAGTAVRTDNGVPFASAHALYGLSKLAVWWLRLGIQIERIKPGHP